MSKNDKTTNLHCPECQAIILEDQRLLELYCPECGLVVETKYLED